MNNMNDNQKKQRPDRHLQNNPMWQRKHKDSSKELMRQKALERSQEYKKFKNSQHHITMDEFLSAHPFVEEYIKSLASKVIKEEINKLVCRKQNERIQIPTWD